MEPHIYCFFYLFTTVLASSGQNQPSSRNVLIFIVNCTRLPHIFFNEIIHIIFSLHYLLFKIYFNITEEGKIENNNGESGIKKLKEILSLGNENKIVEHLNEIIKAKTPKDLKILNEDAKREFNGETIYT